MMIDGRSVGAGGDCDAQPVASTRHNRGVPGLSDSDRDKLRRERDRIDSRRRAEAEHRDRFGPIRLNGPDGVPVSLEVVATGDAQFASRQGPLAEPWYVRTGGFDTFDYQRRWWSRSGFVLTITAPGLERRWRRHRVANEDTAAALLAEARQAVEHGGIAMLRWWATHQPRR